MIPALKPNQEVLEHFIHRLQSVDAYKDPYPHVYVTRCFPEYYYREMLENLPKDEVYTDRTFENRMMCQANEAGPFWEDLSKWMLSWDVVRAVLDLFPEVEPERQLKVDIRLVRDLEGYRIKPHTDIKAKLVSLLFYLPREEDSLDSGTTVMVPKTPFESDGTRRYEFEEFRNVYTAPFAPNSMFGFPRSNISFHGVEPTKIQRRDVLLLNLYRFK